MSKKEYLTNVMACNINDDRIIAIEKIYGMNLEETLKKIISYAGNVEFFDEERRALSFEEILNADDVYEFPFVEKKMIPIIDAYDGDYIVYSFAEKIWGKVNISDGVLFKKRDAVDEVV